MYDKSVIEQLIWLRLCQVLVNERYKLGEFKIPIHLALGHESIAVAVHRCIKNNDSLVLTHRNIHYNLLRMGSLKEEVNEYYLRESGVANGRLGSMNLANPLKNVLYSSSILGNNLPVATGCALGNKLTNLDGVVFVVTGDGAIEEGAFWESLLFAKSNSLNLIIIVENNRWSLGTRIEERRADILLDKLASSLDIGYYKLSSNDPFEYITMFEDIRNRVVESIQPIIVEVNLTTLGYWYQETMEHPDGKFINYHAGPAPSVELANCPIISQSDEDPLHVIKKYVSDDDINSISRKILTLLNTEMR